MKKLVLLFAAATLAVSASAQTVTESKITDNWYVGINGGVAAKITSPQYGNKGGWLNKLVPNAGLRIGKYFTPVVGFAVEGNAYFNNKPYESSHTAVRATNVSGLLTLNLSNLVGRYPGEPRAFEVVALYGLGWGHFFGNSKTQPYASIHGKNNLTSKAGLDFVYNFGAEKQFQIYVEPSVTWGLNDITSAYPYMQGDGAVKYNIHHAFFQANAGLVYKFKGSNGSHNFTIAQLRDQAEIDALNAIINDLRNRKPEVIEKIVEVPAKVTEVKEVNISDLVFVTFAQAKYNLTADAKKALDNVKEGSHVQIVGTASPEGNAEKNQILSENRAKAVADYLTSRGVIVDKAEGKGVQGVTSNRLAVVYVK